MKNHPFLPTKCLGFAGLVLAVLAGPLPASADAEAASIRAENALFVATGQLAGATGGHESFVIPVSGAARIAEIRQFLAERAAGQERRILVATCLVKLGGDGRNRNLSAPNAPAWGWQVVQLEGVRRAALELELYAAVPANTATPSQIENLLRSKPSDLPEGRIHLINFPIVMELGPDATRSILANISDRGFVGSGDSVKITGFVVEGTSPRYVLIRVLGPSLTALGVPGALGNPRFELYRGTEKIAENDDWAQGSLGRPHVAVVPAPSPFHLVPPDLREPGLDLTLAPGAYTVVVSGDKGSTGIVLTEVYALPE